MSARSPLNQCTGCGATLKTGALEGLCARCLFGALMQTDEAPPRAPAGERFGDYELLGIIARGGSGVVHRARHMELDRMVALKILPTELSGEEEFVERFRTEAAAAASLEHPHIVPVYDFGAHGGRHFLAMKLIEGASSAQRMKPHEAAQRLITVARAVHHAHQRGVLHRDLKPGNILLDAHGAPCLTDFGLAKLITREATITRTLAVMGTPAYMAPEQAEGKTREITTAADVYGLGALLYHWLTGAPPFAGGTTVETIRMVVDTEPEPPSRRCRDVDRDLENICLKCLRKEPAARYASADALAADLERWQRGEPVLARPVSALERVRKWIRRNRALATALAVSVLALLSASVVLWRQNVQLAAARGQVSNLAESRRRGLVKLQVETGNRLAAEGDGYAALASFADAAALDADDETRLAMHRFRFAATLAQLPAREQTWRHSGPVFAAGFSSDGTRAITASADGTVRVWNTATGDAAMPAFTHSGPVWWAGFTAGDQRILSRTKAGAVHLWDAVSGAPCTDPFNGRGDMPDQRDGLARPVPQSPDGAYFAVLADKAVDVRRTADGGLFLTLPLTQPAGGVSWSPEGALIAVACEDGDLFTFDARTGERRHAMAAEKVRGSPSAPVGWRSVAWSPDGARLALTDRVFAARIAPVDLGDVSAPLAHQYMVMGTRWSRDASRLLTWSYDNTLRLWEAAALRPAFPPVRLRGPVLAAALSPDEHRIAAACRDGTVSLHEAATGERRGPLLHHAGMVIDAAWSPDGSRLITAGGDGLAQLWKTSGLAGLGVECRHGGSVERIAISPGGTLVAAMPLLPDMTVWRMPAGVPAAVLPHGSAVAGAAWLGENELLTVTADLTLRTWDVAAQKLLVERRLPVSTRGAMRDVRLSPDGRFLAVMFRNRPAEVILTATGELLGEPGAAPSLKLLWDPGSTCLLSVQGSGASRSTLLFSMPPGKSAPVRCEGPGFPLALSAGAAHAAFTDANYSVRVLHTASHKLTPPMPHETGVLCAAFTAGGRILATGTQDGSLRFWDAVTAEPLSPSLPHKAWIMCVTAATDGYHFYTGTNGGFLSAWTVPSALLSPEDMRRLARPQEQ